MAAATKTSRMLALGLMTVWTVSAFADPPAHAPAHGWRAKHDPHYVGFSGRKWERDFDITSGRCNREAIATVVGGVVGGVLANRIADENRTVATLIGVAAGALVGNRIGDRLDDADRSCVGHALEVGEAGRPVHWTNASTGVQYAFSPGASRGDSCREFEMVATASRDRSTRHGVACQSKGGAWEIVE